MNLDKVRVQFQSQNPHKTLFLKLWVDVKNEPVELYAALEKIGFKRTSVVPAPPITAKYCYDGGYGKDDDTLIVEHYFEKSGSDMFNGWTPEEQRKNVPAARAVLRKFGFTRIDHRKLTLADCV
jgi:hypothetical protein